MHVSNIQVKKKETCGQLGMVARLEDDSKYTQSDFRVSLGHRLRNRENSRVTSAR